MVRLLLTWLFSIWIPGVSKQNKVNTKYSSRATCLEQSCAIPLAGVLKHNQSCLFAVLAMDGRDWNVCFGGALPEKPYYEQTYQPDAGPLKNSWLHKRVEFKQRGFIQLDKRAQQGGRKPCSCLLDEHMIW